MIDHAEGDDYGLLSGEECGEGMNPAGKEVSESSSR